MISRTVNMAAFIPNFSLTSGGSFAGSKMAANSLTCRVKMAPSMAYDMDGTGEGSLGTRRIKSSGVERDTRSFKVSFVLPSESRLFTFRELQNVYTTKVVPFSSWYAEQQRIQKMGGRILSVELCSGGQMRSVGNS